jgi:hypothetical protein
MGCNLTEWDQSIFLSRGRTNPVVDAHASTYSIGIPKDTFSVTCHGMTVDAIKAAPEVVIRYDLMVYPARVSTSSQEQGDILTHRG